MTQEFARFVSRIDRHVQEDLVGVLNKLDAGLLLKGPKGMEFGEVQNLSSLVSAGQSSRRPVWEADAGTADLRSAAKVAFHAMVDRLIEIANPKVKGA